MRLIVLAVVLAVVLPATAAGAAPKLRQPVVRTVVPLPPKVSGVRSESCTWTRDARSLLCPFEMDGGGVQVATMEPDGSGFTCLTCGTEIEGTPGYLHAFADGRRFFFATLPEGTANASAGANVTPHIAECAPSLRDCRSLTVSEVALPTVPGDLNDREPRIAPDGRHYLWTVVRSDGFLLLMGELERTGAGYAVTGVRVLNAVPAPSTADEWARRGSFAEGKSFDRGGRLVFAATYAGGRNLDDYSLDLATGRVERITTNLEWDEDAQFDPTSRYLIIGSSRRMHNQLRTTALAATPGFLDAAVIAAVAPASLATHEMRLHTLEKWLTTPEEEAAGGDGVLLNDKSGGWAGGAAKSPWSPDGTRAAWGERGPKGATRLVVVRFPELPRVPPVCLDPEREPACRTPTPEWAPRIEDYPPIAPGVYAIAGPRGGSARLTFGGTVLGPLNRIEYAGFVLADGRVLDGTAELTGISRGGLTQTVRADIAFSGTQTGFHRAQVTARGQLVCGTAETLLGGRRLSVNVGQWNPDCGFKTPEQCPNGADADATETGDCTRDGLPNRYLAPEWCAPARIALPRRLRVVSVIASIGSTVVARRRGRALRSIEITRPEQRARVRLRLRSETGRRYVVTRSIRGCAR